MTKCGMCGNPLTAHDIDADFRIYYNEETRQVCRTCAELIDDQAEIPRIDE